MRYEVLTRMDYVSGDVRWENVWSVEGSPATFATYEEAEEELLDHLATCARATGYGWMGDAPSIDEFRIVPHYPEEK